jgi:hypothetical protein
MPSLLPRMRRFSLCLLPIRVPGTAEVLVPLVGADGLVTAGGLPRQQLGLVEQCLNRLAEVVDRVGLRFVEMHLSGLLALVVDLRLNHAIEDPVHPLVELGDDQLARAARC